jgi:hypothetical protein
VPTELEVSVQDGEIVLRIAEQCLKIGARHARTVAVALMVAAIRVEAAAEPPAPEDPEVVARHRTQVELAVARMRNARNN